MASASPQTTDHREISAHELEAAPAGSTQAAAEPDHSATLNRATPKFTWESSESGVSGPSASGLRHCTGEGTRCEYVLLNVETAGELTLTLDNTDAIDPSIPPGVLCGESPCSLTHEIDGR